MTIDSTSGSFQPGSTTILEYRTCGAPSTKTALTDFAGSHVIGISTPNYHQRMKKGELIPAQPWSRFEASGTFWGSNSYNSYSPSGVVNCSYNQSGPNASYYNYVPKTGLVPLTSFSESDVAAYIDKQIIDSVVSNALVELSVSIHDSSTFFAEFSKLIDMFCNLVRRFIAIIKHLDLRKIGSLSDNYLEWRYGWRTFLYDLEDIDKALKHLGKESPFWKAISKAVDVQTDIRTGTRDVLGNIFTYTQTTEVTVEYKGTARGTTKPPSFGGNIAVTAWELVPFSFVVDWFLNIGTKIALLGTGALWAGYDSFCGVKFSVHSELQVVLTLPNANTSAGQYVFTSGSYFGVIDATLYRRIPWSPGFIPTFKVDLNTWKVLDLLALLRQALSRN